MKKIILNLGKALNKQQLNEIKGGSFFHRRTRSGTWCRYSCIRNTDDADLDSGQSQSCYLELPYFVYNVSICGSTGGGGPIDGPYA